MSDEQTGAAQPPESGSPPPGQTPQTGQAPTVEPQHHHHHWDPDDPNWAHGARRGGVAFGLVLIAVGVVLLVGRYFPWFDLVRLWPLIVVAAGVVQVARSNGQPIVKRIAEGAGTIAVGLVLLGNTFGFISWAVWVTMLALWPVLIVALGIELLGRGLHLNWVRALSNVLLILALFYGVFVLGPNWTGSAFGVFGSAGASTTYQDSAPHLSAVTQGDAAVKVGALQLTVAAGDQLAAVSGSSPSGEQPRLDSGESGGVAQVNVTEPDGSGVFVPVGDRSLALTLDRSVTWRSLRFDMGAVQAGIDLTDLDVQSVDVNVGASNTRIVLGKRAADVKVDVSGGATSVTVVVPADAAVTVDAKSGLSNVNVPASFEHLSGFPGLGESTWSAKGSGGPRIALSMESGVASLNVETY